MKRIKSLLILLLCCFLTIPASAQPVAKPSFWKNLKQVFTFSPKKAAVPAGVAASVPAKASISVNVQRKLLTIKSLGPVDPHPQVLAKAIRVSNPIRSLRYLHAVWRVELAPGKSYAYLKMTTQEEIARTKQFHKIVKDILPKFDLIDVEYPRVLAEGYGGLPASFEEKIKNDMSTRTFNTGVREVERRTKIPCVFSAIDTRGVSYALQTEFLSNWQIRSFFRSQPITAAEWAQVEGFVKAYNRAGFLHGDVYNNFYLKRGLDGRLKLSILDFEPLRQPWKDSLNIEEWKLFLIKDGCLLDY